MSFLKLLRTLFRTIFSRFERVPQRVDPDERTTRFILSRDHFRAAKGSVNVAAFIPPQGKGLSVYRTYGCTDEKVWWLGCRYVSRLRSDGRPILARADLQAKDFTELALEVRKEPNRHPRHANVINWPIDKPAIKMKAIELANKARLLVKPS